MVESQDSKTENVKSIATPYNDYLNFKTNSDIVTQLNLEGKLCFGRSAHVLT